MAATDFLSLAVSALVIAFLILVALTDYQKRRIPNRLILVGVGLYAVWALVSAPADPVTDSLVALAMFTFGFICWLLRLLGAGDAKFLLACGLFTGYPALPAFAVALFVAGLAMVVLVMVARREEVRYALSFVRLAGLERDGKIPFGVPLALATIAALLVRLEPVLRAAT